MARRAALADVLGDDTEQPAETENTPQPARKAAQRPRKRSAGTSGRRATKKAQKRSQSATKPAPADDQGETTVKAADVAEAKRVSLYVHPDDYRALMLAKLEDGADLNSRIRAMIAVWQADSRVKLKVDRLAKSAPRGGAGR